MKTFIFHMTGYLWDALYIYMYIIYIFTKEKVGTHFSEVCGMNVGAHQGLALSPLFFPIVVDVVANEIKEGMSKEILYAYDIVW